jgi:hypothetical protein
VLRVERGGGAFRASEYRKRAANLRALAQKSRNSDVAPKLRVVADSFDLLAEYVERWEDVPTAAD